MKIYIVTTLNILFLEQIVWWNDRLFDGWLVEYLRHAQAVAHKYFIELFNSNIVYELFSIFLN